MMISADLLRMISEGKFPDKDDKKKKPDPVKDDGEDDGAEEKEASVKDSEDEPAFGKKDTDGQDRQEKPDGKEGQNDPDDEDDKDPVGDDESSLEKKVGAKGEPADSSGEPGDDDADEEDEELEPDAVTGNSKSKIEVNPKVKVEESRYDVVRRVLNRINEGFKKPEFISVAHHAQMYHHHERQARALSKRLRANVSAPERKALEHQIMHHDARCNHHAGCLEGSGKA